MAKQDRAFTLESRCDDALPLVNHFLERLRIDALLAEHVPPTDRRQRLAPARALGVLVRNVLLTRVPLYSQQEWAARAVPYLLGLTREEVGWLNDDRVGRSLDALFDADRATLITRVVVRAVSTFSIDLDQLHNDSTTVTFTGDYRKATGRRLRGKQALAIRHGHNKDHRPDLKQLLFVLTVSADGAVPIHYQSCDGNTGDVETHIATWEVLRALTGRSDFLYVADCKLCSQDNLQYIDSRKGRFITVLPRSRREDAFFRDWLQQHTPPWQEVAQRDNSRRKSGPPDLWKAMESPIPAADGYRIVWVFSSLKAELDQQARQARIEKAWLELEGFRTRPRGPRSRFKTRPAVIAAVTQILDKGGAQRWVAFEVHEHAQPIFRQEKRGRPGPATRYVRGQRLNFGIEWKPNLSTIEYDVRCDGIFPLITNCRDLSPADLLEAYKYRLFSKVSG